MIVSAPEAEPEAERCERWIGLSGPALIASGMAPVLDASPSTTLTVSPEGWSCMHPDVCFVISSTLDQSLYDETDIEDPFDVTMPSASWRKLLGAAEDMRKSGDVSISFGSDEVRVRCSDGSDISAIKQVAENNLGFDASALKEIVDGSDTLFACFFPSPGPLAAAVSSIASVFRSAQIEVDAAKPSIRFVGKDPQGAIKKMTKTVPCDRISVERPPEVPVVAPLAYLARALSSSPTRVALRAIRTPDGNNMLMIDAFHRSSNARTPDKMPISRTRVRSLIALEIDD